MSRILVVDDDPSLAGMVKLILELEGHKVTMAFDGQVGLNRVTSEIQLVITDVRMPVMNGIELARRIRERYPKLPIVALTANKPENDLELRAALDNCGFDTYIQKPFEPEELIATVKRLTQPPPNRRIFLCQRLFSLHQPSLAVLNNQRQSQATPANQE